MPLSKEAIQEFQAAYKEAFNEELAFADAQAKFAELICFFRDLLREKPKPADLSTLCALDDFPKISD